MKWVLAAILFIMVMTFSFSDAYGINVDNSQPDGRSTTKATDRSDTYDIGDSPADDPNDGEGAGVDTSNPPTNDPGNSTLPVPEPTTLIILASGLAVIYAAKFGKKQK